MSDTGQEQDSVSEQLRQRLPIIAMHLGPIFIGGANVQ